jgi:hypothetical protein
MTDRIRLVDYFYTHCADSPGEAYRLVSRLKESGVNLLAFSAFPEGANRCQVDFIPENPDLFRKAMEKSGMSLSERKRCFLIDGADRYGVVADVLKRLADAKINVTAVDAVCGGSGRFGALLWVKPTALAAAATILGA